MTSTARRLKKAPWTAGIVLTLVLAFTLLPIYWMVTSSFKASREIARIPATLWPQSWSLEQFEKVFAEGSIVAATGRSLVVSAATTLLVVAFASLAGYAVTHMRYRATKQLMGLSLVTQLLPQAAVLVPVFILWSALGLVNSIPGVVLVYFAFQLPVAVWIISGHFRAIPGEVIEAADVDGSSRLNTLVRIDWRGGKAPLETQGPK